MNTFLKSIMITALVMLCCPSWAQTGTLKGVVTDAKTGEPLVMAFITVPSTTVGTSTDFDGNYLLTLPVGKHQIKFSCVGYNDSTVTVTITEGKQTVLNHAASTEIIRLEAVTVAGAKYSQKLSESYSSVEIMRVNIISRNNVSTSRRKRRNKAPKPIPNTANYQHIEENGFKDPTKTPLSTLSIDVDKASYTNVRKKLNQGTLPEPDAVRVEEMINYFAYNYPQPADGQPFSISMEAGECPWNTDHQLVLVGIQGKQIELDTAAASNLVFLIDVSGSMSASDKLDLVVEGLRMLVENLRPQDYVTIVTYAGAEGLALPPTPGTRKDEIYDVLDNLQAGGSTAGGAGIMLAYKMAREHFMTKGNNRVILATDGDFNVGMSSDGALQRLIEKERESGVFLSVIGVGEANLMDCRMNMLAEKGNGVYYFLDSEAEAHKIFVRDMRSTLFTIAKDVKIQVEFNPALVKGYRLIGYETRLLNDEDFNNDKKDAGEIGAGHSVTALYEIIPASSSESVDGVDDLKYQKRVATDASASGEWFTIKFRYKEPKGIKSKLITQAFQPAEVADARSENFRFACAVVGFGLLLRDSAYKGNMDFEMVASWAEQSLGEDPFGYREEFVELVEIADELWKERVETETKK